MGKAATDSSAMAHLDVTNSPGTFRQQTKLGSHQRIVRDPIMSDGRPNRQFIRIIAVKGVGEAGTIGSTPCIVNAVMDALAPLGVRHIDMPLYPEKVWRAIRDAKRA